MCKSASGCRVNRSSSPLIRRFTSAAKAVWMKTSSFGSREKRRVAIAGGTLTHAALALISRNPQWIRVNMPASLGKPFYP